jgi:hypothetical protein
MSSDMASLDSQRARCIGGYRPSVGGYCSRCGCELPLAPAATVHDESRLLELIGIGHTVEAIKYMHERFGLDLAQSKLAVEHMYVES